MHKLFLTLFNFQGTFLPPPLRVTACLYYHRESFVKKNFSFFKNFLFDPELSVRPLGAWLIYHPKTPLSTLFFAFFQNFFHSKYCVFIREILHHMYNSDEKTPRADIPDGISAGKPGGALSPLRDDFQKRDFIASVCRARTLTSAGWIDGLVSGEEWPRSVLRPLTDTGGQAADRRRGRRFERILRGARLPLRSSAPDTLDDLTPTI